MITKHFFHVLILIVNNNINSIIIKMISNKVWFHSFKNKLNWCFMPSFENQIQNTEFLRKNNTFHKPILI